jgi:dolichyl-diphosphooligosaccharide--protein glycosyltransferase
MGSEEEEAYKLARYLDANYVLVIFGGVSYYSGDDISKFLWMIRIAGKLYSSFILTFIFSWCLPTN